MRIRKKSWAPNELEGSEFFISDPLSYPGKWNSIFPKKNPFVVELGCGKGLFLAEYAKRHLDINFLGIDIKTDILAVAHRTIRASYSEDKIAVDNIRLTPYDIERIRNLFSAKDNCAAIYIHFPNPWPKDRHKKRRLTHTRQLLQYRDFLADDGTLYVKTDDEELFLDTIKYLDEAGFDVIESTTNYYSDVLPERRYPPTEHESRFHSEGKPIYYLSAK